MAEWTTVDIKAQGAAIGAGQLDPRDLAEAYLDAATAHAESANVYARLTPERARAEAAAAAERARTGQRHGPLDGVAISWKDNVDTAGIATEAGSRLLEGRVPARDAPVLTQAGQAGLVCLGKTHLSELAFSGLGLNPMAATAPNALMPGHAPGGSSSGAAASVALGLAGAGIGSDTGGSVRIPAAWNGLVGLKTTAGLIPTEGVVPLAASLDTIGPLTRTVEDAALLLAALTGKAVTAEVAPAPRLLIAETTVLEGCDAAPLAAFEAALARLSAAGATLARRPVPEFAQAFEIAARLSPLVTYEAWAHWGATIQANPGVMYSPIERRFRQGATLTPEADRAARAEYAALSASLIERLGSHGLIALPSVPCLPPENQRLTEDDAYYTERNLLALRNTRLANMLGLSALTLPLPEPACGLMLFGPPGGEDALIAAGRYLERVLL
ncbi:MAG: amidase family protein [Pseudomonadota bacterium]